MEGSPDITQNPAALAECLKHSPHYHACVLGPVPFGHPPDSRVVISVDTIHTSSREEAEEVVWAWVRRTCEAYDQPYNANEWDVAHLIAVNCN